MVAAHLFNCFFEKDNLILIMRIPTLLAAACLFLVSCQQEEGCTDPTATNFNPEATEDDGSCIAWQCGDPFEHDDYNYSTVQIGEQCWFAENLRTTLYANGDLIPAGLSLVEYQTTSDGFSAVYGEGDLDCTHDHGDIDMCDESQSLQAYGRLYNPYAVLDERGLCPTGWHVPTDSEWTELEDYIGGSGREWRATTGWYGDSAQGVPLDPINATDDFGFSALPGGSLYTPAGQFGGAGEDAYWFSSSTVDAMDCNGVEGVWARWLNYEGNLHRFCMPTEVDLNGGEVYSVRCLLDAE